MARARRPHLTGTTPPPSPVKVTHVLGDLAPGLRSLALEMAGGDRTRIVVLRPGAFEIIDPVVVPARTERQ